MGYEYFMQPEPRENLGAIRLEHDKIFGRRVKVRRAMIGMIRNASVKKEVKVFLEPFPHVRIEKAKDLQGWYKGKNEKDTVRPRPCYTEALLTEPYGGFCPVGCIYCYINSGMRGYRGTGLITVPLDYGKQIEKQISLLLRGSAGYFTPFHDPFNPLEKIYHNSQEAAEAFVEVGLPIFFLSRLLYPEWAIDLLTRSKYSYAQKSINTSSEKDWHKMSPGAASLEEHYKDITRLHKRGIYVSIQVNPIMPGVTSNEQIIELFKRLGKAGADHVIVKFVEAGYSWVSAMVQRVKSRFGEEKGTAFESVFTQNIGGEKAVAEEYRLRAHRLFKTYARRCGLTYSVCYEYRYERDDKGEIINKTGISIGPEVTTSAQCHGHRVPIHTRPNNQQKFNPLKVCPPSGCLYCADQKGGHSPCGDPIFESAPAIRLTHLKKPMP